MPDQAEEITGKQSDSQLPASESEPVDTASFPIRIVDVLLYDLRMERIPEHMADAGLPGGTLSVDLLRPLITGTRMEVALGVHLRVPHAENPAWTLDFRINGVFQLDEGLDPNFIQFFVQGSVVPMLWPYARELVQNLTVRMRVLPVVLPPLPLQVPEARLTDDEEPTVGK